jgi:hypothetical protein
VWPSEQRIDTCDVCQACQWNTHVPYLIPPHCLQSALYYYCIGLFLAPAIQSLCENTYT